MSKKSIVQVCLRSAFYLLVFSAAVGSVFFWKLETQAATPLLQLQMSDGGCGGNVGLAGGTSGGWSGWTSDANSFDADCVRVYLSGIDENVDFRVGLQMSDNSTSSGCGAEVGGQTFSPWASTGGGSTGWATDSNAYDPNCAKIYLETRPAPAGASIRNPRVSIQASDQACSAQSGGIATTPTGGGWSSWTADSNAFDFDCLRMEVNADITPLGKVTVNVQAFDKDGNLITAKPAASWTMSVPSGAPSCNGSNLTGKTCERMPYGTYTIVPSNSSVIINGKTYEFIGVTPTSQLLGTTSPPAGTCPSGQAKPHLAYNSSGSCVSVDSCGVSECSIGGGGGDGGGLDKQLNFLPKPSLFTRILNIFTREAEARVACDIDGICEDEQEGPPLPTPPPQDEPPPQPTEIFFTIQYKEVVAVPTASCSAVTSGGGASVYHPYLKFTTNSASNYCYVRNDNHPNSTTDPAPGNFPAVPPQPLSLPGGTATYDPGSQSAGNHQGTVYCYLPDPSNPGNYNVPANSGWKSCAYTVAAQQTFSASGEVIGTGGSIAPPNPRTGVIPDSATSFTLIPSSSSFTPSTEVGSSSSANCLKNLEGWASNTYTTGPVKMDNCVYYFKFAVNGVCSTTTPETCNAGTYVDTTDTSTQYKWNCNGVNGGTNVSCSFNKSVPPTLYPDLTASAPLPQSATKDVAQTFTSTISNIGNASTGASFPYFFQTAGAGGTGGVINLASATTSTLAAGATRSVSISHTWGSTGTKSIRACADKSSATNMGVIDEGSNEGNNCSSWRDVVITATAVPVVTISVSPTSGTAPVTPSLTWNATNSPTSCTESGAWSGSKPTSGTNIAQTTLSSVGTYTYTLTCTNTGGTSSPASATVTVSAASVPDLTAGAGTPVTAVVNTSTPYSATITNNGTAAASGTITHLFQFDEDANHAAVNATRTVNTTSTINASGGTAPISTPYTFATTGTKYIRACADNNASMVGTVNEGTTGESNNCGAWTAVTVSGLPYKELTASAPTPTSATVNVAQNFSSTITNSGNTSTGVSFANKFQVSTLANGGGTITEYTVTPNMAVLGPSGSAAAVKSITFTSSGIKYMRACADQPPLPNGAVSETTPGSESNNCSAWTAINVGGVSAYPDLIAGGITPSSAKKDQVTNFSATISNVGAAAASGTITHLFQFDENADHTSVNATRTVNTTGLIAPLVGNVSVSTSYTFGSNGTKYIRACADNNASFVGTVNEGTNEGNNCGVWTPITVTEITPPPPPCPSCSPEGGTNIGVDNVSISAPTVKTDGTRYNITVVSHKKSGGSALNNQYALINMQGANAGAYRGFLTWYRLSDAWPTAQDKQTCSGAGGYAVVQNQSPNDVYGEEYIHLDSCNVSDSAGGVTTTIFTVHFTPLFTSPVAGNDISGLTCDGATCTGWINFDINFGLDISAQGTGGVCEPAHYGCITGESKENKNESSAWTWKCLGTGGAPTATCTEVKKKPTFEEN